MPVIRGNRHDMRCLRSKNKKDVRKSPKPVGGSQKVIVIKGRFQRTHKLTQAKLRQRAVDCNVKCTKYFTKPTTHAVVDLPWALSEHPRLKEGIKLMKPEWLMASKNGILASSEEYQWKTEKNEKTSSKSHVVDHVLLTPPDSLHHSTTIEREHQSPAKCSKKSVDIVKDRLNTTAKVADEWRYYIVDVGATFAEKWKLNVYYALDTLLTQTADEITDILGQGGFGTVIKARENKTKREVAIKIARAKDESRKAAKRELRILAELEAFDPENVHQCLHKTHDFEYKGHICIVVDLLCQAIDIFMSDNGDMPFPESHIQSFARQLFKSVAYLHRRQIIHNDIKPENILLYDDSYQDCLYNENMPSCATGNNGQVTMRRELLNPKICLIDFGSATFQNENYSGIVVTKSFRAPEFMTGLEHSFAYDIWSIGCVLVEFLTGSDLFCADDNVQHFAMIEKLVGQKLNDFLALTVPECSEPGWELPYPNEHTTKESIKKFNDFKNLSDIMPSKTPFFQQFLDLLQKIFVLHPSKRITAEQALNHPWLKEN